MDYLRSHPGHFWRIALLTLALELAPTLWGVETRGGPSDLELKATALNQVVHFVRWPAGAFPAPESPLTIGLFGADPFGGLIDQQVRGESASGHPVKIVRCFTLEAALACHVVFVADSTSRAAVQLLQAARVRSILTISGDEALVERGGIMGLRMRGNRIQILVNLESAKRANLMLSSKLLRLAEIVRRP